MKSNKILISFLLAIILATTGFSVGQAALLSPSSSGGGILTPGIISILSGEAFFTDTSVEVGIGTTTPGAKLDVSIASSTASAGLTSDLLYLTNDSSATSSASRLSFRATAGSSTPSGGLDTQGTTTAALTGILKTNYNQGDGDLAVSVLKDGTLTEAMRISSAASVGIGTTTPSTDGELIIDSTSTTTLILSSKFGTKGGCIQFEGPASTTFRAYATTTGPLILESGSCK